MLKLKYLFTFCLIGLILHISAQDVIEKPSLELNGPESDVYSLAVNHKKDILAAGAWDKNIHLWETDSLSELNQFRAHYSAVTSIEFSPDGSLMATASSDAVARIWKVDEMEKLHHFPIHEDAVNDISFSPNSNGRFFITASEDGKLRIFDLEKNGKMIREHSFQDAIPTAAMFGIKGRSVILGMSDGSVREYSFIRDEITRTFNERHGDRITAIDVNNDGTRLITSSNDKTAIIWDYRSGEIHQKLNGHQWRVLDCDFSTDGRHVLTGSNDGTAIVWEAESGRRKRTLKPKGRDYIRAVRFSKDGKQVYCASLVREEGDAGITVWLSGVELKFDKLVPQKKTIKR